MLCKLTISQTESSPRSVNRDLMLNCLCSPGRIAGVVKRTLYWPRWPVFLRCLNRSNNSPVVQLNLTHYTLDLRPIHIQLLKRLPLAPSLHTTVISLFSSRLDLAPFVLIEMSNMHVICLQVLAVWTTRNGTRATGTFPYVGTFRNNCHLFSVAVMISCPIVPAAGHWHRVSC